jgi:hypothetical protein
VPITVTAQAGDGEPLATSEENVSLYIPKGSDKQIWLASVDGVTVPASGRVLVAVQVGQLPDGVALTNLQLRVESHRAREEGIKSFGSGMLKGGALTCCAAPLLALVGLILLIVGLVRGKRQPRYRAGITWLNGPSWVGR